MTAPATGGLVEAAAAGGAGEEPDAGFTELTFTHSSPVDRWLGEDPDHTSDLVVALRRLVEEMWVLRHDTGRLVSARPSTDPQFPQYRYRYDTGYGGALLVRTGDHTVHVIGNSAAADRTRRAMAEGAVHGWTLHPLPDTRTPLHVLHPMLTTRYYGLLSRSDYATVEEVAATPDIALLDLRGAGPKFITAIRAAIADLHLGHLADLPINAPSPAEDSTTRRQQLVDQLDPDAALRNRDLVELLVRSSIPATGLQVIARALNAEPAPPADPTVVALLDTAGETAVLGYYTGTRAGLPPDGTDRSV